MAKRRGVRAKGAARKVHARVHKGKVQSKGAAHRVHSKGATRSVPAGRAFQELVDVMRALRGPGGCPWDREQTFRTLRPFVLEETYEVLDAIDRDDYDDLRGEIGDLLFEGVFLAQIAADEGRFTVADSLQHITRKLIRRHPHVFGSAKHVRTAGQVLEQWEQIKSREQKDQGGTRSALRGMPKALPALLGAHEIGTRAAAVGFDWARAEDVVAKIDEEVAELRDAARGEGRERVEEEMGDLLFAIANLARKLGIEAESALRSANQKFTDRFQKLEQAFEAQGRSLHGASLEEMEATWQKIKE
jgi:nucleoside triphosphate diphosphatase